MPVLRPYEPIGSTDDVWFETTKPCFDTVKSHLNRVTLDSGWEAKLAEVLEAMPEVVTYVKNQGLNCKVPYTFEGRREPTTWTRTSSSGCATPPTSRGKLTAELESFAALPPRPHARPAARLEGQGRAGPAPLEVPVVPIYIQEKILPQAIIENLRDTARKGEPEPELTLFNDYDGIEFEELVEFYRHEQNWANRMILGDSLLVMTSLAEKEGLKGKVQMIYIDPPYGIKFGSNWQVSTRKRDVKDGKAEDATRQPEQIKRLPRHLGARHPLLPRLPARPARGRRELLTAIAQNPDIHEGMTRDPRSTPPSPACRDRDPVRPAVFGQQDRPRGRPVHRREPVAAPRRRRRPRGPRQSAGAGGRGAGRFVDDYPRQPSNGQASRTPSGERLRFHAPRSVRGPLHPGDRRVRRGRRPSACRSCDRASVRHRRARARPRRRGGGESRSPTSWSSAASPSTPLREERKATRSAS
jgi:hypothetical protein